jgi:hypothetical protein
VLSAHVHPEFGYLCPSRGLRRGMRITFAFAVLGTIAGINGVASLMADHDSAIDSALLSARSEAELTPAAVPTPVAKVREKPLEAARPVVEGPAAAVKVAVTAAPVAASAAKSDAGTSTPAMPAAAKPQCEDNTWAYLDGKCVATKVRKVRVARPAPNNGAAPAAPASAPDRRQVAPSPSKPAQAATADASASAAATEPSSQPAAATKKPQKPASTPSRPRNPADPLPGRDARAGAGHAAANSPHSPFAQGPFTGFLGLFR